MDHRPFHAHGRHDHRRARHLHRDHVDDLTFPSRRTAGGTMRRVREVFDSVADRYDLMNDLMSLGLHRVWKRFALMHTGLRPGGTALDLGAGSGDLSLGLARQVGQDVTCIVAGADCKQVRPRQ